MARRPGSWGLLEYATDLFDRGSAQALGGAAGAAAGGVRLRRRIARSGGWTFWRAAERASILRGWNATARALAPATLPELFGAQAARTPEALAVVCGEERLSYGELEARANRLAHHLRALGVGPESIVGLCVERSPEMVVGLLGILKAGGAYLPLDPGYPAERLAFMLADAGARVLVAQSGLLERLGPHDARVVRLDADWPAIAGRPATAPAHGLSPHNSAYVIYTSGSTGTPKGVAVTHGGVVDLFAGPDRHASWSAAETAMPDCAARVRCLDLRDCGVRCSTAAGWC